MLQVLLSWIVIAIVFLTFGHILAFIWNKCTKRGDVFSLFDIFWLGVANVTILTTLASLVVPIGISVLAVFLAITIICLIVHRRYVFIKVRSILNTLQQLSGGIKATWILSILCVLILSIGISLLYDSNLYHIQTMMWLEQYSVVPGLGNVHGRLSFNSTFLLLSTLFNHHPAVYPLFYSLSGLFLTMFVSWLIVGMSRRESLINNVISGMILVLSIFFFSPHISSTSTDIPGSIIVMYLLLGLLERDTFRQRALVLFLLPALCITFKLSTAPICLLSLYVLYSLLVDKQYKTLGVLVLLGLLVALPWLTRFVVMSGYLLYPFPSIDVFSFDWKIPLDKVELERDLAYSWARNAHLHSQTVLAMPTHVWLPMWFSALSLFNKCLYILAAIAPIAILFEYKLLKGHKEAFVAWTIAFVGLLFATVTAPDPRFSFGFLVCVIFIPFAIITYSRLATRLQRLDTLFYDVFKFYPIGLVLLLLWLNRVAVSQLMHYHTSEQSAVALLYETQAKNEAKVTYISYPLTGYHELYTPSVGDGCSDQCLPCTPYYNPKMEMRGSDLQSGFRIMK